LPEPYTSLEEQGLPSQQVWFIVLTSGFLLLFIGLLVHWQSRPLKRLARAARDMSLGADVEPVAEGGGSEVVEVGRALNAMRGGISRYLTERSQLFSAISHDLRTPLTTLIGATDTALPHAPPGPSTELLHGIHEQATSMQRLIENLLDMARMQERGVRLNRQWHSLEEIVGSALRQLREPLARHAVHATLDPLLPLVEVDALLIERVLVNLLDNAAKYTPPGTVICVTAGSTQDSILLHVSDNGPGRAPANLFEPFARGQQESSIAGIGLGLALAKRIVEAHGGRIEAKPGSEHGMHFIITLPAGTPPTLEAL